MQYLMEHSTHPTIEEIFCDLSPFIPTLSKATVYNTLKLLYEQKAVLCLTIDDKNTRYDALTTQHGHFKCKKCGMISDVTLEGSVLASGENDEKLNIEETQVYFFGTCEKCK